MKFKTKKLGMLTNLRAGIGFPNAFQGKQNEQIPFYKVGDISREFQRHNYYLQEADNYVSYEDLELLKGKLFEAETIVFAKVGEALKLNRRCILTKPALIDNNVFGIKSNSKELDNKYLFYYLLTVNLAEICRTGAVPSVNQSDVNSISIPLPDSIEEQQEIVQILDTMNDIIRLREKCISHAQALIPALFQEMFGNPIKNEKKWNACSLNEISNKIVTGPFGSSLKKECYIDDGKYKIYGQEQVIANDFSIGNYYISEEKFDSMKRYAVEHNDILVSLVGTFGKIAIVPEGIQRGIINPRLLKISLDTNSCNSIYFKHLLLDQNMKNLLSQNTNGVTMGVLNMKIMKSFKYVVPPLNLQEQFAQKVIEIESYIKEQQEELENAKQMFQSLLHHAFTGELTRRAYEN